MDRMKVSITDHLAGFVQKKVRSGRYNDASEVVRDALRRMEDQEARELRMARPAADDIVADLTDEEIESVRNRARSGIDEISRGEFIDYTGKGEMCIRDRAYYFRPVDPLIAILATYALASRFPPRQNARA